MKLFVGLGNPGAEYVATRHNIGFAALDTIVLDTTSDTNWKEKFNSAYIEIRVGDEKALLIKPVTYMNESGRSVGQWVSYYDLNPSDVYVFYDDMDIPFNKMKLKTGGSAGGHNGIKSIISHLGTEQFHRIRLGIGRPLHVPMAAYVLGKFSKEELVSLDDGVFAQCVRLFQQLFNIPFKDLMATYNQKEKNK